MGPSTLSRLRKSRLSPENSKLPWLRRQHGHARALRSAWVHRAGSKALPPSIWSLLLGYAPWSTTAGGVDLETWLSGCEIWASELAESSVVLAYHPLAQLMALVLGFGYSLNGRFQPMAIDLPPSHLSEAAASARDAPMLRRRPRWEDLLLARLCPKSAAGCKMDPT